MNSYKEQRKFWLSKLRDAGVEAPASMYPLERNPDYWDGQIDRMKAHITQLAEFQSAQKEY